jgi:hypothetical protein
MGSSERTDPTSIEAAAAAAAAPSAETTASAVHRQGGYEASKPEAPEALDDVRINCLMNARYHATREAFLDTVHRWLMFGVIAFGAGAVINVVPAEHDWLSKLLGACAAIFGALDLTFDLSNRARAHSLMKRRYFELLADLAEGKKTESEAQACCNRYSADEEPAYIALLMRSWNAAQEMLYGDDAQEFDIPAWDRFWQNVWRFSGKKYPVKPATFTARLNGTTS